VDGTTLLKDLSVVLLMAGLVSLVFRRLRLPVVLGYIAAGLIIGPHTPPYPLISDHTTIETLAHLGIVVMMFSLGLEFDLARLKKVGGTAALATGIEIIIMLSLGYATGQMFGWSVLDSLFLGAIVSISSTTIIVKVFGELGVAKESFAELVFGILVMEDVIAVLLLALLSTIAMTGSFEIAAVALTLGKLALFIGVTFVLGVLVLPRLFTAVANYRSNEMMLVTSLGLAFGLALLALQLGFSEALGAFIAGALIAEAGMGKKVEHLTESVRDMFGAVFFVAIGLLIDPRSMLANLGPIAVITVCVLFGKTISVTAASFLTGNDRRSALRAGMSMAQIGEFSFIIASLGLSTGVTSPRLYPIAVAVSVITTLTTPFLVRGTDKAMGVLERRTPSWFIAYMDTFSAWTARRAGAPVHPRSAEVSAALPRLIANASLIAAIFLGSAVALRFVPIELPPLPAGFGGWPTVAWLGASIAALPLIYGSVKKFWVIADATSEVAAARAPSPASAIAIRVVVRLTLLGFSCAALLFFVLFLSSTIQPPLLVLGVAFVGLAVVAVLFRKRISARYGDVQALFSQRPAPRALTDDPTSMATMLRGVRVSRVVVAAGSSAVGRPLMELRLRTETGATVVAIERPGALLVNPDPSAVVEVGDRLLLLGEDAQVEAARARFA